MTYDRAIELLGLTTPKPLAHNARLAAGMLRTLTTNAPLRYKVACQVVIDAGN